MQEMPEKIIKKLKTLNNEQIKTIVREAKAELKKRLDTTLSKRSTNMYEYVIITGVVESIDNLKYRSDIGLPIHKPFPKWTYKLKDITLPAWCNKKTLKTQLEQKEDYRTYTNFLKSELPSVGDRVRVRIRMSQDHITETDINNARIVGVITDTNHDN